MHTETAQPIARALVGRTPSQTSRSALVRYRQYHAVAAFFRAHPPFCVLLCFSVHLQRMIVLRAPSYPASTLLSSVGTNPEHLCESCYRSAAIAQQQQQRHLDWTESLARTVENRRTIESSNRLLPMTPSNTYPRLPSARMELPTTDIVPASHENMRRLADYTMHTVSNLRRRISELVKALDKHAVPEDTDENVGVNEEQRIVQANAHLSDESSRGGSSSCANQTTESVDGLKTLRADENGSFSTVGLRHRTGGDNEEHTKTNIGDCAESISSPLSTMCVLQYDDSSGNDDESGERIECDDSSIEVIDHADEGCDGNVENIPGPTNTDCFAATTDVCRFNDSSDSRPTVSNGRATAFTKPIKQKDKLLNAAVASQDPSGTRHEVQQHSNDHTPSPSLPSPNSKCSFDQRPVAANVLLQKYGLLDPDVCSTTTDELTKEVQGKDNTAAHTPSAASSTKLLSSRSKPFPSTPSRCMALGLDHTDYKPKQRSIRNTGSICEKRAAREHGSAKRVSPPTRDEHSQKRARTGTGAVNDRKPLGDLSNSAKLSASQHRMSKSRVSSGTSDMEQGEVVSSARQEHRYVDVVNSKPMNQVTPPENVQICPPAANALLLCSEAFVERWSEVVVQLSSMHLNSRADSDSSVDHRGTDNDNGKHIRVTVQDTSLLEDCKVDIEFPVCTGIILSTIRDYHSREKRAAFIERLVTVAGSGRYNTVVVLLCIHTADEDSDMLKHASHVQQALFCPTPTAVAFHVIAETCIAGHIYKLLDTSFDVDSIPPVQVVQQLLADPRLFERLRFLLALVPALSLYEALGMFNLQSSVTHQDARAWGAVTGDRFQQLVGRSESFRLWLQRGAETGSEHSGSYARLDPIIQLQYVLRQPLDPSFRSQVPPFQRYNQLPRTPMGAPVSEGRDGVLFEEPTAINISFNQPEELFDVPWSYD